jgi:plastocyanin
MKTKSIPELSSRATWMLAAGVTALAIVTACGSDESPSGKRIRDAAKGGGAAKSNAAVTLKKVDPATAGTISGVVKFEGTAPPREPIDMSANPDCMKMAGGEQNYKEDLVVNDGKVEYAFLCLDVKDSYEVPAESAVIDQKGCRYHPHVMGIQAGQKFNIKSSDPTSHNVHWIGKSDANDEFNFAMVKPSVVEKVFVPEEGMLKFKCDVHPWMGAWVGVKTHPFFATSAADGTYTIKNVPPGEYDLKLHHESMKLAGADQTVHVKVETGKTATADFTLKLK